jgi:hypothetical protein
MGFVTFISSGRFAMFLLDLDTLYILLLTIFLENYQTSIKTAVFT